MRRQILICILALAFVSLPVFCIAQSSGTGAEASSEPASSCARIQLGAIGSETEETTDQTQTGTADQEYMDSLYYEESQAQTQEGEAGQGAGSEGAAAEGQTIEEWNCNEELNADGTLTCFKPSAPDVPVICTVEGENVFCPE